MKTLKLFLSLAIALSFFTACEEDEPKKKEESFKINCETFASEDYLTLIEDLEEAGEAYGSDPSVENCQAYFSSLDNYIDVWKAFVTKCYPEYEAQYSSFWSYYEGYLNDLSCE